MDRDKKIIRTSIIGIGANVLLAAFKAVIGLASNSVAIVLDAVNNLSDAMSSLITIIGTKLAAKEPDRKHPLGYGRIEYLSAMIISAIVLYAGITALVESVKKIIDPATPDYSTIGLIIVGAAVLVKILLGRYVEGVGKKVASDSLIASGKDALFDAVLSFSTLVAAVIYIFWHVRLEAWLGAIIALFIIKAGLIINDCKALAVIQCIKYEKLNDRFETDIFTEKMLRGKLGINAIESTKSLYDLVVLDSMGVEKNFAEALEQHEEVVVYTKLPSGFYINTPMGKYNPDWAVAFREGSVKHIYFVAESKGNDLEGSQLRGSEESKIECARRHFATISDNGYIFDVAKDYQSLYDIVTK